MLCCVLFFLISACLRAPSVCLQFLLGWRAQPSFPFLMLDVMKRMLASQTTGFSRDSGILKCGCRHRPASSLAMADWTRKAPVAHTWFIPVFACEPLQAPSAEWGQGHTEHKLWVYSRRSGWCRGSGTTPTGALVNTSPGDVNEAPVSQQRTVGREGECGRHPKKSTSERLSGF